MKLVKILFVVIALLVVTSVTYSNHSLDDSQKVTDLTTEIGQLEKENTILRAQVAEAGSLTRLSIRVAELGFTETPKIVTLKIPASLASR